MPSDEKRLDGSDARFVAEATVRRERRRVRLWAALTAGLWVVTASYLLVVVLNYMVFLHPITNDLLTGRELPEHTLREYAAAVIDTLRALLWWPVTLAAAAAGSIWFTLATRRATLRQIQTGLVDISEQLQRLGWQT